MSDQPNFPGYRRPTSDFRAVSSDFQTQPLMYELDLTSARSIAAGTAALLKFAGNSLYVDQATDVGNATLIFQDDSNIRPARIFTAAGFNYRGPWTQLLIENTAQVGKTLRLFYGVDIDFQPGLNAQVTIVGAVSTQQLPDTYGATFVSAAALAAVTSQQVFAPAANVNGARVWSATGKGHNAAGGSLALQAHTAAPNSMTVGDVLETSEWSAGDIGGFYAWSLKLARPIAVAAGKGVYFTAAALESNGYRSVRYTLL